MFPFSSIFCNTAKTSIHQVYIPHEIRYKIDPDLRVWVSEILNWRTKYFNCQVRWSYEKIFQDFIRRLSTRRTWPWRRYIIIISCKGDSSFDDCAMSAITIWYSSSQKSWKYLSILLSNLSSKWHGTTLKRSNKQIGLTFTWSSSTLSAFRQKRNNIV